MLFGKLEWVDIKKSKDIYYLKRKIHTNYEVPSFIKIMLYYVRYMKFDETPDYNYLIDLMVNVLHERCYVDDNKFEWNSC